MDYFYLDGNNKQQGPVAVNELPKYSVTRETKVWKQGMSDWQTVGSIPELSGIFPPPITPPPPPIVPPPIPSVAPPPYQTTNAIAPMQKPDNLLVWSILATAFCCIPSGIYAIFESNKVDNLWNKGDYTGAQKAANNAKTACFVALGLGIIGWIIFIIFYS